MASDLLASIRPWPVEDIEIGGAVYRIAPHPAATWLRILLQEPVPLFEIIPGLLEPDAVDDIQDLIIDGGFSRIDLEELIWDIVGIVGGRPWWTCLYLLGNAKHASHVQIVKGALALHGVDATRISLSAWFDAVYMIFAEKMDTAARQRLDLMLAKPPPGIQVKTDANANRAAFAALMA